LDSPVLCKLNQSEFELLGSYDKWADEWFDFAMKDLNYKRTKCNSQQILMNLGSRDSEMLNLMVQIALSGVEIKEAVCEWMGKGGFIDKPRSFKNLVQIDGLNILEKNVCQNKDSEGMISVTVPVSEKNFSPVKRTISPDGTVEELVPSAQLFDIGRFVLFPNPTLKKRGTNAPEN